MNRHEATRKVLMSLAFSGAESRLSYVAPDGSRPIVVCTPNEYLGEVTQRVDALGGAANLILAETNRFRAMVIETVPDDSAGEPEDVNGDISMGMFWIRTQRRKDRNALFHIAGVGVSSPQSFAYA